MGEYMGSSPKIFHRAARHSSWLSGVFFFLLWWSCSLQLTLSPLMGMGSVGRTVSATSNAHQQSRIATTPRRGFAARLCPVCFPKLLVNFAERSTCHMVRGSALPSYHHRGQLHHLRLPLLLLLPPLPLRQMLEAERKCLKFHLTLLSFEK